MAKSTLPAVLAGPILRRVTTERLTLWLATTDISTLRLTLSWAGADPHVAELTPSSDAYTLLEAGTHLQFVLLDIPCPTLPQDTWIHYDLEVRGKGKRKWTRYQDWAPDMSYGDDGLKFQLPSRVKSVLHGSCRKPHFDAPDGLAKVDDILRQSLNETPDGTDHPAWPSMLVLSGDQIYADDASGPMLHALHQLHDQLGVYDEDLSHQDMNHVADTRALMTDPNGFYARQKLLPQTETTQSMVEMLFGGVKKPIFTSDHAGNHLITLSEYMLMYLLVWSPAPWALIDLDPPTTVAPEFQDKYAKEKRIIEDFVTQLPAVRRSMAHVPVAMIFDDHETTDDWNLHRGWEEEVYNHPFSNRIMGNGLMAYLIFQGWGNAPEQFPDTLMTAVAASLKAPGSQVHEDTIEDVLRFEAWDYDWHTSPPLVVLDTRTRRWRSETSSTQPSGLLDWEALTDLQHRLRGLDAVMLVSASPIFGVKIIEIIQRLFTWFGKPLMVDAENWMAHPGTANGILNVFRHRKTPETFIVLSGDVHYSFVYDVEMKGRRGGPQIWQICSSGLKNQFPGKLLAILDWLNRWLFAPRSPLNWFTRRRAMRVIPRHPSDMPPGRRLLDASGIGVVELDENSQPWRIRQFVTDGSVVSFTPVEDDARWR